jgi:hypothetical protein
MKRVFLLVAIVLISSIAAVAVAAESSIDKHLKDLKNKNPEVRAEAAYELGCG